MNSVENMYFSFLNAGVGRSDGRHCWDIHRKRPILDGASSELLELIAQALSHSENNMSVLIDPTDHYLTRDLQLLGLQHRGFLFRSEDTVQTCFQLRDGEQQLEFVGLGDLPDYLKSRKGQITRSVLTFENQLCHDPRNYAFDYIEFCKSRERYFNGLTQVTYQKGTMDNRCESNSYSNLSQRTNNDFDRLISSRKSPMTFKETQAPDKIVIDSILKDCFFKHTDGSSAYAVAGGLSPVTVSLVTTNTPNLELGLYRIDSDSREWIFKNPEIGPTQIFFASFSQECFVGCKSWLVVTLHFDKLVEKYGARAYRFGLMASGAFLHQFQISASSFGVQTRILGGFDDTSLNALLNAKNSTSMIPALIGLGI